MTDAVRQAHALLELEPGAPISEVKQNYRELAQVWHPDRFAKGTESLQQRAARRMRQLNEAYMVLLSYLASCGIDDQQGYTQARGRGNVAYPVRRKFGDEKFGYVDSSTKKVLIEPAFERAKNSPRALPWSELSFMEVHSSKPSAVF